MQHGDVVSRSAASTRLVLMVPTWAWLFLSSPLRVALAANASAPHPHQGIIPRLPMEGKPKIKLTAGDMKMIEDGQLWMKSVESNGIGRGVGVRDMAAPPDLVFRQISDLEGYVGKVPMLSSLKTYSKEKSRQFTTEKAAYIVRVVPGYNFEYYVEHRASSKTGVLLFFLDYDRYSDFNDLQGKWYLEPHPTKPGWTRVFYQCDLKLFGYAPKIVKTLLTSKGLSSAISWVKRYSEASVPKSMVVATAFVGNAGSWGALEPPPFRVSGAAVQLAPAPEGGQPSIQWHGGIPRLVAALLAVMTASVASRRTMGRAARLGAEVADAVA